MFVPFGSIKVVRICAKDGKSKLPGWLTVREAGGQAGKADCAFDLLSGHDIPAITGQHYCPCPHCTA